MKTLTIQQVIGDLKDEMARIETLKKLDDPQESDEYREPLSIDKSTEVKILLSWGGPEDGFKLKFDNDKQLLGGVYYLANWGEYQEVELNDDEAEEVFNFYIGGSLVV